MTGVAADPEGECGDAGDGHLLECGTTYNPCPAVANIDDVTGSDACGECVKLTTSGSADIYIHIVGKVDPSTQTGRIANKYYVSSEGLEALGASGTIHCYDGSAGCGGQTCSQITIPTEAAAAECTFDVSCIEDMDTDNDPEGSCSGVPGTGGHENACGHEADPCPATRNIAGLPGNEDCASCAILKKGTDEIYIRLVGKINTTTATSAPKARWFLSGEGLKGIGGSSTPTCYNIDDTTGTFETVSDVSEKTSLDRCPFTVTVACQTTMGTNTDPDSECVDAPEGHILTCGTTTNPCPVIANTNELPDADFCGSCFSMEGQEGDIHAQILGKVTRAGSRPDADYYLSEEGMKAFGVSSPVCYDVTADGCTGTCSTAFAVVKDLGVCKSDVSCIVNMKDDHDDAGVCSADGHDDECGSRETPCPVSRNTEGYAGNAGCSECVVLSKGTGLVHAQIVGKLDVSSKVNAPEAKYFLSAKGYEALSGTSTPVCYNVDDTAGTFAKLEGVEETFPQACDLISVGCQTTMSEADVDPAEQCSEGAGHMDGCGSTYNPCPAVANINDINGGDDCGECVILKKGTQTYHIQIMGKVDQKTNNRPYHKYYLSPAGMIGLIGGFPVCFNIADDVCGFAGGDMLCSAVSGMTETTPGECAFGVSCITDMVGDKDPEGSCSGLTGHEDDCGSMIKPCPATRNLVGLSGAEGCDECLTVKKGEKEISIHVMGKIDLTLKPNAPEAKYFLSLKGLQALGASSTPTCYNVDDSVTGATMLDEVTETADYDDCADSVNVGCQTTMGDDTDPDGECSEQGAGGLDACGTGALPPCPLVANVADVAGSTKCGDCVTLEAEDGTKVQGEILGKVTVAANRPANKYYTSPEGMKALGVDDPQCYVIEGNPECTGCSQVAVGEKDTTCATPLTIGCQTTMTEGDVDPEDQCDEGAGHLETCGEDFNPCPAVANINDIAAGTSCGDCVVLTKDSATIHIQILGKADDTESGMNRPDFKYYLSPEGLKKLGVAEPVCYSLADKGCTGACSSVTDWAEAAAATCKFGVSCIQDMTTNKDPADSCTDLTAHDNTCGTSANPCPATRNIAGFPGAEGCDECLKVKKGETELHVHVMGKIDIAGKTNAPKAKYFLSSAGLVALGHAAGPTCHKIDDTQASVSMLTDVTETSKYADCPEATLTVGCQTTMAADTDPDGECSDEENGDLDACGTGDNPPCPLIADVAQVSGGTNCGECVTLTTGSKASVLGQILGKVTVEGSRPKHKYYTSPEGLKALGVSDPACYVVADDTCASCSSASVTEGDGTCPGAPGRPIGCQTTMTESDVDPEEECDEGAGHLETCGEDFNPCPAVANINDISGGTSCGDCVVLTKGTATIHIQILGKADDKESGADRPDFKYFLSPEGLKKLGVTDPVCYSLADNGCTGTCSSVTDWTEAAPAECKFDVSCIDDMVDDKDPASVCSGLTGNEDKCGAELAPCPATRNLAGFPGADGCGECFELKKGTTTIHAQMMGKIDITGKDNAPAVKYFLSSKGLETLGSLSSVPTCYKIDDTAAGASKVEDVTEPGKYGVCDAGSNVGCQSTMGTDTDPEDQCKDQADGDLEACGEEAKPCPLIANIADVATDQRCGECLTLEKADSTKKHFEILGKVKVEGNRPENKFYTSPEGLKALGESNPTCYVKETDAACTSCTQIKVAEDDATCPTRTTAAVTTTKAGAARLSAAVAATAAAAIYAGIA